MSDNIEFISAAELPEAEAEDIDILCVDNGELKKKSGANLGVRSWNQLEDRPFDKKIHTVSNNGDLSSNVVVGGEVIKVSDLTMPKESMADATLTLDKAQVVPLSAILDSGEYEETDKFFACQMFLIAYEGNIEFGDYTYPEAGIYMPYGSGVPQLDLTWTEYKKLDTKYLPEALQVYETEGNVLFDDTIILDGDNYGFAETLPITNDKKYKVILDGVEYERICRVESPDAWLEPIEIEGQSFYIYDGYIYYPNGGTHTLKIVEADSIKVKQFDKKFIPGLPYCVEVYSHGNNEYTCDLSYYDIYKIIETGTLVYAVIKFENIINGGWVLNASYGYYYFNQYSMPDDDILNFVSPDGRRYITFFGGGSIAVGSN